MRFSPAALVLAFSVTCAPTFALDPFDGADGCAAGGATLLDAGDSSSESTLLAVTMGVTPYGACFGSTTPTDRIDWYEVVGVHNLANHLLVCVTYGEPDLFVQIHFGAPDGTGPFWALSAWKQGQPRCAYATDLPDLYFLRIAAAPGGYNKYYLDCWSGTLATC